MTTRSEPKSVLTAEQLAEVQRRRAEGFKRGDPKRIDRILERNNQPAQSERPS